MATDWEDVPEDMAAVWEDLPEVDTPLNLPKKVGRKKPPLPSGRQNIFPELQRRFGDSSTVSEGMQRSGVKMKNYDKEELLKRYYRDQLGSTPEKIENPFVPAGKYWDDLGYGAKTLGDAVTFDAFSTPEEQKARDEDWLNKQMIYGAADKSPFAEWGGLGINVAPALLSSPAAGIGAGAATKKLVNKNLGEYMQRAAHRVAGDRTVKSPVVRGAMAGGAEGAVQPVNPDSSTADKTKERFDNILMGNLFGGAGNWAASRLATSAMGEAYNKNLDKAYPNLPITPKITADKAYGSPTLESFREGRKISQSGVDTPVSNKMQDITDAADRSIRENIGLIEESATGSGTPISIGEYGNKIVDKFLKEYNKSKGTMNKLYGNVKGLDKVQVTPKDFGAFFGNLNNKLRKKFVTTDADKPADQWKELGPLRSVVTRMQNLAEESKGNFDLIDADRIYNLEKDLNLQLDKVFSSDVHKHLRSTGMEIKNSLRDFTDNTRFVMRDPRSGRLTRATKDNNQAMKDYQTAKQYAATHYDRFTGEPALEDLIKYTDDPEWKAGRKVNPGSDLMNEIFQGESIGMKKDNAPRANTILKLRHALPNATFDNISLDDALRKEAFAAMRGRPEQYNLDEFVQNIDRHIAPGGRSAIYDPEGAVKLFDEKTFAQLKELADATRQQYTPVGSLKSEVFNYKALPQSRYNSLNRLQDMAFAPLGKGPMSVLGGGARDIPGIGGASKAWTDLQVANSMQRRVPGEYDSAIPLTAAYGAEQSQSSNKPLEDKLEERRLNSLWDLLESEYGVLKDSGIL